jgi:hypothetical protein
MTTENEGADAPGAEGAQDTPDAKDTAAPSQGGGSDSGAPEGAKASVPDQGEGKEDTPKEGEGDGDDKTKADGEEGGAPALELTLPDDVPVDAPERFDAFKALMTEARDEAVADGIDATAATKAMAALGDKLIAGEAELVKQQVAAQETQKTEWEAAVKADKEMGGANFPDTMSLVAQVRDSVGEGGEPTPEASLTSVFVDAGIDNHPEIIRLVAGWGRDMAEDDPSGGSGGGSPRQPSAAEVLYGKKS